MLEFDWMEFTSSLCKDYGKKVYLRRSEVAVFWNDNYVGDDEDFFKIIKEFTFTIKDSDYSMFYAMAKEERLAYFSRNCNKAYIYFDINFSSTKFGRLVFELHSDLLPKTCDRFMKLCLHSPLKETSTYYYSSIYRVVRCGWLQGGHLKDVPNELHDESHAISHERSGVLSLCNDGKNSSGSDFFVTLAPARWMDGSYIAFGKCIEGYKILEDLGCCEVTNKCPNLPITICDCEVLPFGRGIKVREEFIKEIVNEIGNKWERFIYTVSDKKERGSGISIHDELFDVSKEDQEVDSNTYYIIDYLVKNASNRITEPALAQYLTAILLDVVMNTIDKFKVQEDIIDIRDASSERLLLKRYIYNLYSNAFSNNSHFIKLLDLSLQCKFIHKSVAIKQKLIEREVLSPIVLKLINDIPEEISEESCDLSNVCSVEDYESSSLNLTEEISDTLLKSTPSLIKETFRYVKLKDMGRFMNREISNSKTEGLEEVIKKSWIRVSGFHKRRIISTPIKYKTLCCVSLQIVKSVLETALDLYRCLLKGEKVNFKKHDFESEATYD